MFTPKPIQNGAPVTKMDSKTTKKQHVHRSIWMPHSPGIFSMVCTGASGSGKTTTVMNMIFKFLEFDRLMVFAKNPQQDIYDEIKQRMEEISDSSDHLELDDIYSFSSSLNDIPNVEDIDTSVGVTVMLIDDFVLDPNLDKAIEYFIRGRHAKVIPIFLSQSYNKTPILIRQNARILLVWRNNRGRDISYLYADAGGNMEKDTFKKMFNEATNGYNFLYIDNFQETEKRFRKNFDQPLTIGASQLKKDLAAFK